ncbi:hypothetical protein JCM5296_006859 [Sporobolomyces johnsonii]
MTRLPPLSLFALAPVLARAAVVPTAPGGVGLVFRAGGNCWFKYDLDSTGTWKAMDVDLMSGSNTQMVNVTRVASGLDGTTGNGSYSFVCPEVDPPAPIYFYQFSSGGQEPVWTSRFTVATANGTTNTTQPDGQAIAWGIGHLVNGTSALNSTTSIAANSSSSLASPNATATGENVLDPFAQANSTETPSGETLLPASTSTTTTQTGWNWQPSSTPTAAAWGVASTTTSWGEAAPTGNGAVGITGFMHGAACDSSTKCPDKTPCCSEYGFCGTGRNCLAGCDPLASFQPGSCAPVPACVSQEYALNSGSSNRILLNSSTWNGDATTYDWLVDSIGDAALGPMAADATSGTSALTLSLTELSNGTTITSTRSLYYGNVTARIRSVAGAGILTGFALQSGAKDEIDLEFTTNATNVAQTAYFWQGQTDNYASGQKINVTDRSTDYHDYTISWMPDAITWLVDGVAVRNVSKNSTADASVKGLYHYPQTPSQIKFLVWAIGGADQPQGLVDFVGGPVEWNASAYTEQGYYASYVSSLKVECYDTSLLPNFTSSTNTTSGAYNASTSLNNSTAINSTTSLSDVSSDPAASTALDPAQASATPSASTTLWWTPASVASESSSSSTELSTSTSTSATLWWTPTVASAKSRLRRLVRLEKVRRDSSGIESYSYGSIGDDGQIGVSGGSDSTTIVNDASTGTNMQGTDTSTSATSLAVDSATRSATGTATDSSATATDSSATATDSSASSTATSDNKTVQEKWNDLGEGAHIGIYIAGAVVAVALVALVGWLWRKAASTRPQSGGTPKPDAGGSYARIGDQGEMLPTGQVYTGTGEILPGMDLYSGGQAPAAILASTPSRKSSTASRTPSLGKYQGGYVPSSQLRAQYGVDYQPQAKRQV